MTLTITIGIPNSNINTYCSNNYISGFSDATEMITPDTSTYYSNSNYTQGDLINNFNVDEVSIIVYTFYSVSNYKYIPTSAIFEGWSVTQNT